MDPRLTIPAPRPWAIRRGNSRRVLYIRPLTLVSTMVSQSSRSHLGAGSTPRASPALLINPRSLAKDGGRLAIASSMDFGLLRQLGAQRIEALFTTACQHQFPACVGKTTGTGFTKTGGRAGNKQGVGHRVLLASADRQPLEW